jgi:hypothetical protein
LYDIDVDGNGAPLGVLLTEKAGQWGHGVMARPPKNAGSGYWGKYVGVTGVACGAPGDCVAVGEYYDGDGIDRSTVLAEKAGKWQRGVEPALPADANGPEGAVLFAVSCASRGNCTAVGSYSVGTGGYGYGLLLTETAGSWARGVRAALAANSVVAVSCASPGNCGAVGSDSLGDGILLDSTT